MKRIIKISLILLLVGMAVIAAVPFFKEKRTERKYENEFKNIQESVTEKKSDVKQGLHRLCGNTGNNNKLSCDADKGQTGFLFES